jgi:hypothetical protein
MVRKSEEIKYVLDFDCSIVFFQSAVAGLNQILSGPVGVEN